MRKSIIWMLAAVIALTAYGTAPEASDAATARQKLVTKAKRYIGTPYEYGSNRTTTRTFDCSDFVKHVYRSALGKVLPADSRAQGVYVRDHGRVTSNYRALRPGDLLFFMSYRGSKASSYYGINKLKQRISHVGIYLGNGKMIHTYSKDSGGVRIDSIGGRHWEHRFMFGGTVLK